jgi:hypothetical protein
VVLFDANLRRLATGPLAIREGGVMSVAFGPDGKLAAGIPGGVVLFDANLRRLAPGPLVIREGGLTSVAFGADSKLAAGFAYHLSASRLSGGVVLVDSDPEKWHWETKAAKVANRNLTRLEWTQYFPDHETPYHRTVRSLPWPLDLPEAELLKAEEVEQEHPEVNPTLPGSNSDR